MSFIQPRLVLPWFKKYDRERTWGSLPEWFRNDTAYHDIYHAENSFVFVSCLEDEDEAEKSLIESAQEIEKQANAKLYVMQRIKVYNK